MIDRFRTNLASLLIYILIALLTTLLFVDGEVQQQHRLLKDIWDAGHLLLFGLPGYLYVKQASPGTAQRLIQAALIITACVVLGIIIENLQTLIHREFSVQDIFNNVLGGLTGFCFALIALKQQPVFQRWLLVACIVLLAITGLRNFEIHLLDEIQMRMNFPQLSSFNNRLEITRWDQSNARLHLSKHYSSENRYSLEAEFLPGRYSTIYLQQFIRDWSQQQKLKLTIYNPGEPVKIVLKIYDQRHIQNGLPFSDRYNKSFHLKPGQNLLSIPLSEVSRAPENRLMDLHHVKEISLFTTSLKQPHKLYLTKISLD